MTCEANQSANSESSCLGMQLKLGGKPHLMLNTGMRPIANKYVKPLRCKRKSL